jgi:hypothetical protein
LGHRVLLTFSIAHLIFQFPNVKSSQTNPLRPTKTTTKMDSLISTGPYTEAHKPENLAGPGDGRPTTYQILKDNDRIGKLKDKTFLITGGTDGLGRETVRQLAKTGARVFFSARSPEKAEKVVAELKEEGKTDPELKDAKIEWIKIDNNSLKSVREGVEDFMKRSKQLNVLICNAGTY